MLVGAWWEVLVPCLALSILVTGLALLNFAVDEIANPQLRSNKHSKKQRKKIEPPQVTELEKHSEITPDVSFTTKT
jgi:peptide/nickel transport system permease protein